jgi:UDP-3-O-[3-hydroxymyristoyl] N-acetylglucosamine deacetylase
MHAQGLARGGSLDNALVYDEEGPMQPLQWPNEVVRHKVLDLIGDFALLGAWPQCEVIAIKSGHAMHARVINELRNRG